MKRALRTGRGDFDKGAAPYLLINKNALPSGATYTAKHFTPKKDAHNERAQRQDEIERRLVGQLGDRFRDAQLLEVSEGSYLIRNRVKLPIFGKKLHAIILTKKDNIDKYKKSYYKNVKSTANYTKN